MDKIVLNRFSVIPLYRQLFDNIQKQIDKKILKPGELIPTEKNMANLLGISIVVVRQAYASLRKAGLIVTYQGKGSYIAKNEQQFEFIQKLASSFEEGVLKGHKVSTEVLEIKIESKNLKDIKNKLKLKNNDSVVVLKRLRSINDIKMFLWTSYLPASKYKSLIEEDFSKGSLYNILEKKFNTKIFKAERYVEVIKANSYNAGLLGIPELDPIFFIESLSYTKSDIEVEYYRGWYPTNYTKFYFEVY